MDLRTEALSIERGGRVILKDMQISLPRGSRALMRGPPASGKTSLLKCLAALHRPAQGSLYWGTTDVFAVSEVRRRRERARIGFVFQTDALFDSMSVFENVLLPLRKREVAEAEARERALGALSSVGLEAALDVMPERLSGGMRKRVGIARALVAEPEVLLADDPLAGLDPETSVSIVSLLERASRDRTLVLSMPAMSPADAALPAFVMSLTFSHHLHVEDGSVHSG